MAGALMEPCGLAWQRPRACPPSACEPEPAAKRRSFAVAILAVMIFGAATRAQPQSSRQIPLQLPEKGSVPRRQLPPGHRIRQLHFSLDGRLLLAQDDEGIAVLTVEPFSVRFRIAAKNIVYGGFTPDSRQVVLLSFREWVPAADVLFAGPTAHLERWSHLGMWLPERARLGPVKSRTDKDVLVAAEEDSAQRAIRHCCAGPRPDIEQRWNRAHCYRPTCGIPVGESVVKAQGAEQPNLSGGRPEIRNRSSIRATHVRRALQPDALRGGGGHDRPGNYL